MLLALAGALTIALAGADEVPRTSRRPVLGEVEREAVVRVESTAVGARYVPGRVGIEIDTTLDAKAADAIADAIPEPFVTTLVPIEGGTRIRTIHPSRRVEAGLGRTGDTTTIVVGAESEEARLRQLGVAIARPLPLPKDLGPELELWQEAEAATAEGELTRARELWEKLEQAPSLDDLAAARIAELYVMSGHVNEATARLRAVSRRHPQSTGAALARLDQMHLELIAGGVRPTIEQIDLAAQTSDRRGFEPYAGLRAALLLEELGRPTLALRHLADPSLLPEPWIEQGNRVRARLLEEAVAVPALRGDALASATGFTLFSADLADHERRAAILRAVADAMISLGLFDDAVPLLRELLRNDPNAADEAMVVLQLADAYAASDDLERGIEVVRFAITQHPHAPGLLDRVRSLVLRTFDRSGLDTARERLADLRGLTRDAARQRDLLALECDLVLAYGDADAQVQVLTKLRDAGWDDVERREPRLALALASAGRATEAAPLLRKWIGRTTDPEARDRLAYRLAEAELALLHDADAEKILELIARSGTVWGRIARLRLRERSVAALLPATGKTST
jgi:tetratricopeptide (TPR) repeat protein